MWLGLKSSENMYKLLTQVTPEIDSCLEELCNAGIQGYNYLDPFRKVKVLSWLVEIIYELSVFRTCMSGLLDRQAELNKEKLGLIESKSKNKKELDELKREMKTSEDYLDSTEKELEQEEKKGEASNKKEAHQMRMRVSASKKKVEQIQSKIHKLSKSISDIEGEIEALSLKVPFLIYPVKLLGRDRHRNKYYFFSDEPTQIYFEPATEISSLHHPPQPWMVFRTEQTIVELRDSLCPHGQRESRLLESIDELIHNRYLKPRADHGSNSLESKLRAATESMRDYSSMYQPHFGERRPSTRQIKQKNPSAQTPNHMLNFFNSTVWSRPVLVRSSVEFLAQHFKTLESEFSRYLLSRNCEWAEASARAQMLKTLEKPTVESLSQVMISFMECVRQARKYVPKENKQEQKKKHQRSRKFVEGEEGAEEKASGSEEEAAEEDEEEEKMETFSERTEEGEWDLNKFRTTRTCFFPFGFYREKVRQAWLRFTAERQTLPGLYLSVAVLSHTLAYFINKKVRQVEAQLAEEESRVKYQFGQYFSSKYQSVPLQSGSSKMDEEKVMSRRERAQNRLKQQSNSKPLL